MKKESNTLGSNDLFSVWRATQDAYREQSKLPLRILIKNMEPECGEYYIIGIAEGYSLPLLGRTSSPRSSTIRTGSSPLRIEFERAKFGCVSIYRGFDLKQEFPNYGDFVQSIGIVD